MWEFPIRRKSTSVWNISMRMSRSWSRTCWTNQVGKLRQWFNERRIYYVRIMSLANSKNIVCFQKYLTGVKKYFLIYDLYGCFCKKRVYGRKNPWLIYAIHLLQLTVSVKQLMNSHVNILIIFISMFSNSNRLINYSCCVGISHIAGHHGHLRAGCHVVNMVAWPMLRDRHVEALALGNIWRACRSHHGLVGHRRGCSVLNVVWITIKALRIRKCW